MKNFWQRWTINCAFGELGGIAAAGAMAFLAFTIVGEPKSFSAKLLVLVLMMCAGFVEGSFLGFFQWRVLKDKFPKIPQKEWLIYTIAVAVLGWFLGMLPSLFFVPEIVGTDNTEAYEMGTLLYLSVAALMGLVLGAIFGLFQWFVLKKYVQKATRWIIANALGWGIGMIWIFYFASVPNEDTTLIFNVFVGAIGGILAGLSVGVVTGWFLLRMEGK